MVTKGIGELGPDCGGRTDEHTALRKELSSNQLAKRDGKSCDDQAFVKEGGAVEEPSQTGRLSVPRPETI